jgi:hypothetical protein
VEISNGTATNPLASGLGVHVSNGRNGSKADVKDAAENSFLHTPFYVPIWFMRQNHNEPPIPDQPIKIVDAPATSSFLETSFENTQRLRHDGWNGEKKAIFCQTLAETGTSCRPPSDGPAAAAVHARISVNIREDSALLGLPLHAHSGKLAPPSTSSTSPPGTSYRHGQKAAFRASLRLSPLAFIFKESDAIRLESAGRSTRDSAPPSNRRRGESHAWRNHRQKY